MGTVSVMDTTSDIDAPQTGAGWARVNIETVEDSAAKHGFGEMGESRFPTGDLGAQRTGLAFHRLRPGRRQLFGHRHDAAEEVCVVIGGSGRVKLGDDVVELAARDALRIDPAVVRCFEAGDDGLELLVFGPRHEGDGEILPGWWR